MNEDSQCPGAKKMTVTRKMNRGYSLMSSLMEMPLIKEEGMS